MSIYARSGLCGWVRSRRASSPRAGGCRAGCVASRRMSAIARRGQTGGGTAAVMYSATRRWLGTRPPWAAHAYVFCWIRHLRSIRKLCRHGLRYRLLARLDTSDDQRRRRRARPRGGGNSPSRADRMQAQRNPGLRWDDLNFDTGDMRLPDSKAGARMVPADVGRCGRADGPHSQPRQPVGVSGCPLLGASWM